MNKERINTTNKKQGLSVCTEAYKEHIMYTFNGFCKTVIRFAALNAYGVHSVDTKSEIVKILHFKQFYKHYVFVEDGEGGRKKVLKNYIDVNVCIDMVCGDTKYELGSDE